jgi:hypothetical protein
MRKRRGKVPTEFPPVDQNKMLLIDQLNVMWSAFAKGAKGCDHEVVEEFLDAKDKAHRLICIIGS